MELGWYAVAWAGASLVVWVVTLIAHRRRQHRAEEAYYARQHADLDTRYAEWQARTGRHRMGRPREVPSSPPAAGRKPNSPGREDKRGIAGWPPPARSHVSAADLRPVTWTYFGEPEPAPAKTGAKDTARLPRVRLVDDSTGGIRAVGDRIVAAIESGEM